MRYLMKTDESSITYDMPTNVKNAQKLTIK